MPFASKTQATDSKGSLKKGYREIVDKNGKTKYLSENKPKAIPGTAKPKAIKTNATKKVKVVKDKKDKGKVPVSTSKDPFVMEAIES